MTRVVSRISTGRAGIRFVVVLLAVFAAGCAAAQTGSAASATAPLAFARAERLKRGINASGWFAQVYACTHDHRGGGTLVE